MCFNVESSLSSSPAVPAQFVTPKIPQAFPTLSVQCWRCWLAPFISLCLLKISETPGAQIKARNTESSAPGVLCHPLRLSCSCCWSWCEDQTEQVPEAAGPSQGDQRDFSNLNLLVLLPAVSWRVGMCSTSSCSKQFVVTTPFPSAAAP